MFSRSKKSAKQSGPAAAQPRPVQKAGSPSIISPDLRILGDIICEGDVQVEGVIEGDVKTRLLTVGETALIKGSVICEEARIRGTVDGEIFARHVVLAKSSRVRGDITHETIAIEAGAYLDGRCRRLEEGENDLEDLLGTPVPLNSLPAAGNDGAGSLPEPVEATGTDQGGKGQDQPGTARL